MKIFIYAVYATPTLSSAPPVLVQSSGTITLETDHSPMGMLETSSRNLPSLNQAQTDCTPIAYHVVIVVRAARAGLNLSTSSLT